MFFFRYVFIIYSLFIPFFSVSAQVVISEIMYDPKDADSNAGGEWIEIQNTGSSPLDITQWIFFEADTNHGIVADGVSEIPSGSYAVISRDLTAFKNYFTGFSGLLFKSSFSLNDGEILAMKPDKESVATDSVTYSSDWGAKNDGNSLQKLDGAWVVGTPTPGTVNSGSDAPDSSYEVSSSESNSSQSSSIRNDESLAKQTIFPNAGPDRNVIAGASVIFEGEALGIKKEPIPNARFVWNFGDGETAEGKKVSHTYRYPGEHIVVLDVASDERSVGDKAVVTVVESKMSVSGILSGQDGYVEILNGSLKEADISWWQISDGVKTFVIPSGTFVLPSKKIRFANFVTNLAPSEENLTLYYPSGKVAYQYSNSNSSSKSVSVAPTLMTVSSKQKVAIASEIKKPSEEISSGFKNAQQAASAAEAASPLVKKSENWKWYLALFGIIIVALSGLIFVGSKKKYESGFTIVE